MALPHVPAHASEDSLLMRADVSVLVVGMRGPVLPPFGMNLTHDVVGAVTLEDVAVFAPLAQKGVADSEEAEMLEPLLGNDGHRFSRLAPFFVSRYYIYC